MSGKVPPFCPEFMVVASRDLLRGLERARKYGDIVRTRVPASLWLIFDPDAIEEVVVRKNKSFRKGVVEKNSLSYMGNGLLTNNGDSWRRNRRLMQPAFHRKKIEAYAETMVRCAEEMLEEWVPGREIDLHEEMMAVTLRIINLTAFGADVKESAEAVSRALLPIGDRLEGPGRNMYPLPERIPTPTNLRYRREMRRLDSIIRSIIDDRRRAGDAGERDDLLSMLLSARYEDTGEGMSDDQIRDEVMTIFLAGHETTANALTWAFHLLAENPESDELLAREVQEVVGEREPNFADVPKLRYATAVFKESMRLYPPVFAFTREAAEEVEIGGYTMPAGTEVVVSQWVTHRDPKFFYEPRTFRPERWLDGSTGGLPRYAYFPFGGGPRQCIGKPFAEMEGPLIMASIVRRYRLSYREPGQEVRLRPAVTLRPSFGPDNRYGLPPMVPEGRVARRSPVRISSPR